MNESTNNMIPTGIMFDIHHTNTQCTEFYGRSTFEFIHNNQSANSIPNDIMSDYVTELNYNYQTPLMYAIILKNKALVKQLLAYDAGKMDSFGKCALDYAYEELNILEPSTPEHILIEQIISDISEYECRD